MEASVRCKCWQALSIRSCSGLEIFVGSDDRARTACVSHDSGDADDLPCPVVQGYLAAQVADQGTFAIGHESKVSVASLKATHG